MDRLTFLELVGRDHVRVDHLVVGEPEVKARI